MNNGAASRYHRNGLGPKRRPVPRRGPIWPKAWSTRGRGAFDDLPEPLVATPAKVQEVLDALLHTVLDDHLEKEPHEQDPLE
jgi:hypothetical protein